MWKQIHFIVVDFCCYEFVCSLRLIVTSLETNVLIKSSINCRCIHLQEFSARTNKLASSVKQPPPVLVQQYGRNN